MKRLTIFCFLFFVFKSCSCLLAELPVHCAGCLHTVALCGTMTSWVCCRELSFKKGDAVNIIRQVDNNWYEGEHRGRIGIFPMSYVEVCGDLTTSSQGNINILIIYLTNLIMDLTNQPPTGQNGQKVENSRCVNTQVLSLALRHWHVRRGCRARRSSSPFVLLLQRTSERSEKQLLATTSTPTPTWSFLSER